VDGSGLEELISGLYFPVGVALDQAGRRIYWTESDAPGSHGSIRRANLDGSAAETLIEGLKNPRGIALDLMPIPEVGIDALAILPPIPNQADPIEVEISGTMTSGPVTVLGTDLTRAGSNLWLNIDVELGPLTVMQPWSYSEEIGRLPEGSYDLTVRAISEGEIVGIRQISFNVIPEPASFGLLAGPSALILLSRRPWNQRTRFAGL